MPIYEYICGKCRDEFSVLLSINAEGKDLKCPRCGCADVQKKLSSFSCCSVGGGGKSSPMPSGGFGGG